MEKIDIINLVLLFLAAIIGSCVFLFTKNTKRGYLVKNVLLVSIICSIIFLLSYYIYLERTIQLAEYPIDSEQIELNKEINKEYDVKKLRDSLVAYKTELEDLNKKIAEYSKLIDVKEKQSVIRNRINTLDKQIDIIDSYNEILPNMEYMSKSKGYKFSNETSSIILYPPKDFNTQYIDFALRFVNDNMVENIACLYVEIYQKKEDSVFLLWDEYYKPREGYNILRIKNLLKQNDAEMRIGFFWKNEFGKCDYPRYESIKFSLK